MNRKQYILETLERQNITEVSAMDAIHLGLDAAGMIPGIGIAADLTNAALYGLKGQGGMAALSLGAAIPVAGLAVGGAKLGAKALPTVAKAVKKVTPTSPATKALGQAKTARAKAKTEVQRARKAQAAAAKESPTIGPATRGATARKAVADKKLETAKKSRKAARTELEAATKRANRSATGSRLVKGTANLAANRKIGLPRAAVLGREEIGAATGMEMGDSESFRYKEGKALVDKAVSGINKAIANLPDVQKSIQTTMKSLDDYKLGSFQS
jgi:hypothetical protein